MSIRILIVDDNATNMKLAADVLTDENCEITCASDAEQARFVLQDLQPDLILMDIAMPGMDGLTLTRLLKADERYRHIPVVALTASAMKGDDERAISAGCSGYITKPIDTRRFASQVFAFLQPQTTQRQGTASPVAATRMRRLLIVDDVAASRRLLRAGLEDSACQVLEANNGLEALEVLRREPVDGVISDILMPRMDGFRLCREIRASQAAYAAVPFVLYTATYDSPEDRQLACSVGADDYLLKPSPMPKVLESLGNAARSRGSRRYDLTPPSNAEVLEQYNAALVRKLEQRNEELTQLNHSLELRVAQRTAALDAANKELESFSYSVAHDLRAPLLHVSGFAELLRETVEPLQLPEAQGHLARILDATRHMNQLIEDLLAFALTAGSELATTDVDPDPMLDAVLEVLQSEISDRNVTWKRKPLPRVRADATLLRQIFANLLTNALKYTRTRPVAVIEIGSEVRQDEAVLYVRDNGIGFDMQHAHSLFGVFKRLHSLKEYEGTGIGLATVHRIITRHGGRVWAEAAVDKGATFYFTLPSAGMPEEKP